MQEIGIFIESSEFEPLRRTSSTHPLKETKGEFLRRLAQSEADFAAGRTRDAFESLREIRGKYGI